MLTEKEKEMLTIKLEKILGKPPHNMITEVIVKELVEKVEMMDKENDELLERINNFHDVIDKLHNSLYKKGE